MLDNADLLEEIQDRHESGESGGQDFAHLRAKRLTARDLEMRTEAGMDPIAARLEAGARERYLEEVSQEVRIALASGLRGVKRWQNGGQKVNPDFRETDLDHVLELIDWANEIRRNYPALFQEMFQGDTEKWYDFLSGLIGHDTGEIVVGDMCRSNALLDKKEGRRHKRVEALMGRRLIQKNLSSEAAPRHLRNFERFEGKDPHDKVVMIAHALDKGQASQNVAKHVLAFNIDREDYSAEVHWYTSQATTMQFMNAALAQMKDTQARTELLDFFDKHVMKHFKHPDLLQKLGISDAKKSITSGGWITHESKQNY